MAKKTILILISLLIAFLAFSNPKKETSKYPYSILEIKPNSKQIDSVFRIIANSNIDTEGLDFLMQLYRKSLKSPPIRYDFLDTIIYFSGQLNYLCGKAKAIDRKGLNARYQSDFIQSLELHRKALSYYRDCKDTTGKMICLNNLAVVLRKLNHEQEAIKYYFESLDLARQLNNMRSEAISLNGIGNVYLNLGQYTTAMNYFRQALSIEEDRENLRGINYDLSNIGEVYLLQGTYDSALYYYEKSMEVGLKRSYKADIAVDYYNLGMVYQKIGDLARSNDYLYQSHPLLIKHRVNRYLCKSYIKLGQNYIQLKDYKKAEAFLKDGLRLAEEIHSAESMIEAYESLSKLSQEKNNYKQTLYFYKAARQLTDSVKSEETKRNIASLETLFEIKMKDVEIEQMHRELELNKSQSLYQYIIIVSLLVLTMVLFIVIRLRRNNNRLIVSQMRNDIQDYINKLDELKTQKESENQESESEIFKQNVARFGLSDREIDVLLLISQGLKNEEIADKLFLSISTVKTHTRNIFQKLDVRNRIEAARRAKSL